MKNRKVLVHEVALKAGISKAKADEVIGLVLDGIVDGCAHNGGIEFTGFGKFETAIKASRTCRNPRTGETMQTAEGFKVKFKAGKKLNDAVNS